MLATDPDQVFEIILPGYKDDDNPPTFVYRFASCREMRDMNILAKKIDEAKEDSDISDNALETIIEHLKLKLVDVKNEPAYRSPDDLYDILTEVEVMQLFMLRKALNTPGMADKKKLGSQPPCTSEKSAKPAQAPQNATGNSQNTTATQ